MPVVDSPVKLTSTKHSVILAVVLFCATVAASLSSAFLLEHLTVRRIDGGSLTTHFPGFVYATATVMKVVIFETIAFLVVAFALFALKNGRSTRPFISSGTLSILLQPAGLLVSTVLLIVLQYVLPHSSSSDSSYISRIAVLALLGIIWLGTVLSFIGIRQSEKPLAIPLLGFLSNAGLLILFYYHKFYKLGFDQDNWAN